MWRAPLTKISLSQRNSSIPNGKLPLEVPTPSFTIKEKGTLRPLVQLLPLLSAVLWGVLCGVLCYVLSP